MGLLEARILESVTISFSRGSSWPRDQTQVSWIAGGSFTVWATGEYAEYTTRNVGVEESQPGIKTVGRNINNLRYANDTILMVESEEELKSLLMKVKDENEKVGLKFNIQKIKTSVSGPIMSWQTNGEIMETGTDFIFLGSKITVDGDCSHEIKRHLLLGRKAMTNLGSILKCRHYFAYKHPHRRSYRFSNSHVWIWELENKKGWALQNWCLQTVVLKKTESPLDSKEIKPVHSKENQHWICIGRTDVEAEAHTFATDARSRLIGKDSLDWTQWMLGMTEGRRRTGRQTMRRLAGITDSVDMSLNMRWWRTGKPCVLQSMELQRVGHNWATEQQSGRTNINSEF